jgi:hypothetical protein
MQIADMSNLPFITDIIIPARLCSYLQNDKLKIIKKKFEMCYDNIKKYEMWIRLFSFNNIKQYLLVSFVYVHDDDIWSYYDTKTQLCYVGQEGFPLADAYYNNLKRTVGRLMCLRCICSDYLIDDLYISLRQTYTALMPQLNPDYSMDLSDIW